MCKLFDVLKNINVKRYFDDTKKYNYLLKTELLTILIDLIKFFILISTLFSTLLFSKQHNSDYSVVLKRMFKWQSIQSIDSLVKINYNIEIYLIYHIQ